MKAILEFDLPEDHDEHIRAANAGVAWSGLHRIDEMLRAFIKYNDNEGKTAQDLAHEVRQMISDITEVIGE